MTPLSSSVDLAKAIAAGHTVVFLILMIDQLAKEYNRSFEKGW